MKNVVLTSSVFLLREGMRSIVHGRDDIRVTGIFSCATDLCARTSYHNDEILIFADPTFDLNEAMTRELSVRFAPLKMIIITRAKSLRALLSALGYGASGILTAESSSSCLLDAIRAVEAGRVYLSVELLSLFYQKAGFDAGPGGYEALTEREVEVFQRVAVGKTNGAIGNELDISVKTVSTHKMRLMEKLGVSSLAELVQFAVSNGLIDDSTMSQYWEGGQPVAPAGLWRK